MNDINEYFTIGSKNNFSFYADILSVFREADKFDEDKARIN
jgi:hypothetical protein